VQKQKPIKSLAETNVLEKGTCVDFANFQVQTSRERTKHVANVERNEEPPFPHLLLWTSSLLSLTSVEMPPIWVILFFPSHSSSSKVHASSPVIALSEKEWRGRSRQRQAGKQPKDLSRNSEAGSWGGNRVEGVSAQNIQSKFVPTQPDPEPTSGKW